MREYASDSDGDLLARGCESLHRNQCSMVFSEYYEDFRRSQFEQQSMQDLNNPRYLWARKKASKGKNAKTTTKTIDR